MLNLMCQEGNDRLNSKFMTVKNCIQICALKNDISMFALLEREVAGKNTMWYQGEEY